MKLLVGALLSISAHGGVLEDASQFSDWTHFWRTSCDQSYEAPHAIESLQSPNQTCPLKAGPGIPLIKELNGNLQTSAENELFAKLATKQAAELKCSAQFAADCSAGKRDDVIEAASQNLLALREAKKEWKDAVEPVMHLTVQSCPQTLAEVENEKPREGATSSHYDVCKRLVSAKLAYATILNSIPFSNLPDVRESLKKFEDGTDTDARGVLTQAYGKVQPTLQTESDRLTGVVAKNGGSSFDRSARYTLLDDPALVQSVVTDAKDQKDVKGLVCSADARYHRGADALSTNLTVGSLALGGIGAVAARTGILATRLTALIEASESAGGLSLQGARSLRVMSLVAGESANVATAYPSIVKNCGSGGPKITAHASDGKTCLSVPTAKQISQDSCILTHTMALLGSKSFKAGGMVGIKAASAAIANPAGMLEAAREKVSNMIATLTPLKQRELNSSEFRGWQQSLNARMKGAQDEPKLAALDAEVAKELKNASEREQGRLALYRKQLAEDVDSKDAEKANSAYDLHVKLDVCDHDLHGQPCRDAMAEALRRYPPTPSPIQGKDETKLRPSEFLGTKLVSFSETTRKEIKTALDDAARMPAARVRQNVKGDPVFKREQTSHVPNIDKAFQDVLGPNISVVRHSQGSKVELVSQDRKVKIVVDPAERYFTIQQVWPPDSAYQEKRYLTYKLLHDGSMQSTPFSKEDPYDVWISKTHFEY